MLRKLQLLCCLLVLTLSMACGGTEDPIRPDQVTGPFSWGAASKVTHLRHLWISDQPDEAGLEIARNEGVGVVINLREASEFDWDEKKAVEDLGMEYFHVAVPGNAPFSEEAFTRIDELVDARDRLERQVAAQTEELRVQRAAIARTQRAVRNLARPEDAGEEEATEPALRDPNQ